MTNKDLIYVIEQIGREKGIGTEVLFEALESALLSASKRTMGVGENVRLARPSADDGELRAALRRARLLDWVDRLPDGLDTHVGEYGTKVSAGQRQRIALARTFLADFPVLVLDEPTEHLDEPTAAALMADALAETAGRTLLLVTHRRGDLGGFDRVVQLDAGVIVAGSQPVEPAPA